MELKILLLQFGLELIRVKNVYQFLGEQCFIKFYAGHKFEVISTVNVVYTRSQLFATKRKPFYYLLYYQ